MDRCVHGLYYADCFSCSPVHNKQENIRTISEAAKPKSKSRRIHKQLKVYILVVKKWKDADWEIIPATGNKLIAYTDLTEAKKEATSYDSFVTGIVKVVSAIWRQ